eukprot:gene20246-26998_t
MLELLAKPIFTKKQHTISSMFQAKEQQAEPGAYSKQKGSRRGLVVLLAVAMFEMQHLLEYMLIPVVVAVLEAHLNDEEHTLSAACSRQKGSRRGLVVLLAVAMFEMQHLLEYMLIPVVVAMLELLAKQTTKDLGRSAISR